MAIFGAGALLLRLLCADCFVRGVCQKFLGFENPLSHLLQNFQHLEFVNHYSNIKFYSLENSEIKEDTFETITKGFIDLDRAQPYKKKYGLITLYRNEIYIGDSFKKGKYWDEDTLLKLKQYINPKRNILEIGGHCGTSSVVYSSFLEDDNKVFVYEPQYNLFKLLVSLG